MSHISRTIPTPLGFTVVPSGPEALRGLLHEFENKLKDLGVPVEERLAPGVDRNTVIAALATVGLIAPEELIAWFGWHNGLRVNDHNRFLGLIPYAFPANLDWAVKRYAYNVKEMVPLGLWAPLWFPLESERGLALQCSGDPASVPLIRKEKHDAYDFLEESIDHQVVSLCTIVSWWLEALDSGAAWRHNEVEWRYDFARDTHIDRNTLMLS